MGVGLELWRDGDSAPYFSTKGGYILGSTALTLGANASGSLSNSSFSFGIPFAYAVNVPGALAALTTSFSGNTLNYQAPPEGWQGRLFYGIWG